MKISHIVRAEEWISSLPKHHLLYQYFEWEMPPIFHTATLRNPDKSKLSKRHGHTNVTWFKENGYLPEAILNFLALLGWSHPEEKEIFSLTEFISLFDLKDIKPVAPIFDLVKLTWMNQQYIQNMEDAELTKRLETFYPYLKDKTELLEKLMPLLKTRMETLKDFEVMAGHFFSPPDLSIHVKETIHVADEVFTSLIPGLKKSLGAIDDQKWNHETIFVALKESMNEYKVRMPVFYTLFTGRNKGLPLPETLEILGKDETLKRLAAYS
jgi:glutamyl-tRNA synthetase